MDLLPVLLSIRYVRKSIQCTNSCYGLTSWSCALWFRPTQSWHQVRNDSTDAQKELPHRYTHRWWTPPHPAAWKYKKNCCLVYHPTLSQVWWYHTSVTLTFPLLVKLLMTPLPSVHPCCSFSPILAFYNCLLCLHSLHTWMSTDSLLYNITFTFFIPAGN